MERRRFLISLICSNWREVKSRHAHSPPGSPPGHSGAEGCSAARAGLLGGEHGTPAGPGRSLLSAQGAAWAPRLASPAAVSDSHTVNHLQPPAFQPSLF